jgi:Zn-dependent M28 family amino/carboxypeptidase
VNLDMPVLTYRFTDVVAFGADRSGLGPLVRAAVAPMGIALTPDPEPEEGIFTRSDHYRFVQQGVPAVALKPGPAAGGAAADRAFRSTHYHQPSDEVDLPIDWGAGVRFVEANYAIARAVADAPARPVWNKGDFFGALYKGPMAR